MDALMETENDRSRNVSEIFRHMLAVVWEYA